MIIWLGDSIWMSPIYEYLNISNFYIQSEQEIDEKVKAINLMLFMEIIMNSVLIF